MLELILNSCTMVMFGEDVRMGGNSLLIVEGTDAQNISCDVTLGHDLSYAALFGGSLAHMLCSSN